VSPLPSNFRPSLRSLVPFSGRFEPPGAKSVASFVREYDKIAAELRVEIHKAAEMAAKIPKGEGQLSPPRRGSVFRS